MQDLHVLFDVSAVAAALGAGAALFQSRGRLRSAEAKRNALQSRVTELEQQRTTAAIEADKAFATVQSSNQRLVDTATQRVAELEKRLQITEKLLQGAEKQQTLAAQRVEILEKSLAEKSLALEQARTLRLEQQQALSIPPPPVAIPEVEVPEIPETPPIRTAGRGAKKASQTILVAASRESKSAGDMETYLTEAGYKVVRATSIANVITTAQESRPDLVTLDTQISGGDNLEALEKFKADSELRDIPVVVVCALKDRDKAIEMGAAGCVAPPITSNVLLGTVKTAFINHRKRMERSRLAKTANTGNSTATTDRSVVLSGME